MATRPHVCKGRSRKRTLWAGRPGSGTLVGKEKSDMSDAIDNRVRELVKATSIETREAIFEDLLRELLGIYPDAKAVPIESSEGELLGVFVRPAPLGPARPRTPEEEAERRRRLATIDEVIDKEELMRSLTQGMSAAAP